MKLKTKLTQTFLLSDSEADKLLKIYGDKLIARAVKRSVFHTKANLRLNIRLILKHGV